MKSSNIHCPACSWKPRPASRWSCVPRCGTVWNTFATGGLCPGCGVRWPRTQCLTCGVVSPHGDWYHDSDDGAPPGVHRDLETIAHKVAAQAMSDATSLVDGQNVPFGNALEFKAFADINALFAR